MLQIAVNQVGRYKGEYFFIRPAEKEFSESLLLKVAGVLLTSLSCHTLISADAQRLIAQRIIQTIDRVWDFTRPPK